VTSCAPLSATSPPARTRCDPRHTIPARQAGALRGHGGEKQFNNGNTTGTLMQMRIFGGRTGLKVSHLALGTGLFGNMAGVGPDPNEARRIFDSYAE
jgi:hypothetical protein